MEKERLDIIKGIRNSVYPLECEGCGYYDCDGDWQWKPLHNQCWDRYTTVQLKQIYAEYIKEESEDFDD